MTKATSRRVYLGLTGPGFRVHDHHEKEHGGSRQTDTETAEIHALTHNHEAERKLTGVAWALDVL